jgi:peptide/nickel transport system substrate-binding protein
MNFNSTANNGTAGKVFAQTYYRQAFQSLVDQPLYIKKVFKGYAVPTYGPVPVTPTNSFASSFEKENPFPYSPSKAKSLLSSHGWKIVPNGTDTCIKAGTASNECGAGIPAGTPLSFDEQSLRHGHCRSSQTDMRTRPMKALLGGEWAST